MLNADCSGYGKGYSVRMNPILNNITVSLKTTMKIIIRWCCEMQ